MAVFIPTKMETLRNMAMFSYPKFTDYSPKNNFRIAFNMQL